MSVNCVLLLLNVSRIPYSRYPRTLEILRFSLPLAAGRGATVRVINTLHRVINTLYRV